MEKKTKQAIDYLVSHLHKTQKDDGSWCFCFESGPLTDAYMIILLRSLQIEDEALISKLVQRLLTRQNNTGTWKLYHDEREGNLSATIEAYFALLYSGFVDEHADHMQKAKNFIINKGGLTNAQDLTKVMLTFTGQLPWPEDLFIPIEYILLPQSAPFNLTEIVGYARVHFIPILIALNKQYQLKNNRTPDLSKLIFRQENEQQTELTRNLLTTINKEINKLIYLPKQIQNIAFKQAEQFMLERIEPDGTLYSYFSATFMMIFALLALGYSRNNPIVTNAINGLKGLLCKTKHGYHIENSTSTVWDTALISHSLQKAGVSLADPVLQKASNYLLSRQHTKYGDWRIHNRHALPGGWGFSDINTINPDVDDTTAALRAIKGMANINESYKNSWSRGVQWVLSMQNNDGGWAAFEKNTDNFVITLLPFSQTEKVFIDPSTPDLTGRTLEFLGNNLNLTTHHPQINIGAHWLVKNQERNGSWYGRWGICYIYGTWAAITGLLAVGIHKDHHSISNAIKWLLSIQNKDGGWGESCLSDVYKKFVPLHVSTPSQTAWALDTLISVYDQPNFAINNGIERLIDSIYQDNWMTEYPTGAALPGGFYIHYHSYRYIWPLLTLSKYRNKYL